MHATQQKIVLCADDDPDDRELLCETATKIDPSLTVIHAENGQTMLQKLHALDAEGIHPCLIILDMNMPIMDGKATLEALKQNEAWNSIPVAIFTTSQSHMYTDLQSKYGVSIVTKPSKYSEIISEVRQLLSYCRAA